MSLGYWDFVAHDFAKISTFNAIENLIFLVCRGYTCFFLLKLIHPKNIKLESAFITEKHSIADLKMK